ncbi:hypothetical protein TNCV_5013321 [Trichonephila clavipes]|nr:hypothetical protein TNCV_5013321 [Trichonephila clavipes]
MSWTYRWTAISPWIKIRGDRVSQAMEPHTITPAVAMMCHCKVKAELSRSTSGPPHTNTIVLTSQIECRFVAEGDLIPFRCSPIPSCANRTPVAL